MTKEKKKMEKKKKKSDTEKEVVKILKWYSHYLFACEIFSTCRWIFSSRDPSEWYPCLNRCNHSMWTERDTRNAINHNIHKCISCNAWKCIGLFQSAWCWGWPVGRKRHKWHHITKCYLYLIFSSIVFSLSGGGYFQLYTSNMLRLTPCSSSQFCSTLICSHTMQPIHLLQTKWFFSV